MWGFIKNLFKKEVELPKEEVGLPRLHDWFDEKTKSIVLELNNQLNESGQKVSKEIESARNNIKALYEAKLMNPDIPERAKHFMEGNREAFSKRVNQFLERVCFPEAVGDFSVFHEQIQEELKELTRQSARPFQILQEFFANESKKVMSNVGVIEKEINLFKHRFDNAGLDKLDETRQDILDLQAKMNVRKESEEQLQTKEKELREVKEAIIKLDGDIILLQKDKELNLLRQKNQEIIAKVEEVRSRITGPFSAIDTAMRKFERITYRHKEIMQKYIDSPLDALMKDLHLSILKALADMQMAILNNRIDMKERKKEKTLETLKLLTKEYLGSFLTEYGQLRKKQNELKKKFESLDVIVLIKQKKQDLEKKKREKEGVAREVVELRKELEKLNIEAMQEKIADNLKKITKTQVTIRV